MNNEQTTSEVPASKCEVGSGSSCNDLLSSDTPYIVHTNDGLKQFATFDDAVEFVEAGDKMAPVFRRVDWHEDAILQEYFADALETLLEDAKQSVNFMDDDVMDALDIEFHTTAEVLRRLNVLAGYYRSEVRVRNPEIRRALTGR